MLALPWSRYRVPAERALCAVGWVPVVCPGVWVPGAGVAAGPPHAAISIATTLRAEARYNHDWVLCIVFLQRAPGHSRSKRLPIIQIGPDGCETTAS